MPAAVIEHYRAKVKRMGLWAAVRYMRNRGLSFEAAHFILFGFMPRKA